MQQRLAKKIRYTKFSSPFPNFSIGAFLIAIFCSFFIVTATFTPLPLPILAIPGEALTNTVEFISGLNSIEQITRVLNYIPQIPLIIMIASMLGPKIGLFSVLLYVVSGLYGIPVFASGGGIEYLFKIRFGYIIGFLAGTVVTGRILSQNVNKLNVLKASILGVLAIHIIGIVYLAGMLLLKQESIFSIFGWILQLSGMQIFYDVLFSIIAAFIGRFLRHVFWVAMD